MGIIKKKSEIEIRDSDIQKSLLMINEMLNEIDDPAIMDRIYIYISASYAKLRGIIVYDERY